MIRPEPGHCQRCEKWSPCLSRTDDGWLCEQCRGGFGWNVLEVSLFLWALLSAGAVIGLAIWFLRAFPQVAP